MGKVKLYDEAHGTYKIKCPAGHFHFINTLVPNHPQAQWDFNGDLENPTFTPSVDEKTGYFASPIANGDPEFLKRHSYKCHFIVTNGKIFFCGDCSHSLRGQTIELPDVDGDDKWDVTYDLYVPPPLVTVVSQDALPTSRRWTAQEEEEINRRREEFLKASS